MARSSSRDQDSPRKRAKHRAPSSAEQLAPSFAKAPALVSPKRATTKSSIPILQNETGDSNVGVAQSVTDAHIAPPASLLPPHLDHLKTEYSFATMSIISSSKIESKVKALLQHIERFSFGKIDAKPGVVALYAKSVVANKLVTVIEIAKRTVSRQKGKLYQYSQLGGQLVEWKGKEKESGDGGENRNGAGRRLGGSEPRASKKTDGQDLNDVTAADHAPSSVSEDAVETSDDTEREEPAFQTMITPERKKIRAVPVLTVFLSRVPVPELARAYGQQVD